MTCVTRNARHPLRSINRTVCTTRTRGTVLLVDGHRITPHTHSMAILLASAPADTDTRSVVVSQLMLQVVLVLLGTSRERPTTREANRVRANTVTVITTASMARTRRRNSILYFVSTPRSRERQQQRTQWEQIMMLEMMDVIPRGVESRESRAISWLFLGGVMMRGLYFFTHRFTRAL